MELVVGASEASMKSLLGKLGGILAQEYTVIRAVRGDIQYINDELATIQAFLGDLYSSPDGHDLRLKDWMKQIRDMGYDMEDCIDDFAHRVPLDSLDDAKCSFIVSRIHELWTFWPRREIAFQISELKVRAQHIAERRTRYGINNPNPTKGKSNSSSSGAGRIAEHIMSSRQLIHTSKPMGEVKDMEKLRGWLKHNVSKKHHSVLSLVGFGGMGKTTIATALYRDFRNEFDCQASVTVSQNYDEEQFLREILGQIEPKGREQQQGINTLDKKSLVADITSPVKRFLPLRWKQGSEDNSTCKIEPMNRDQHVDQANMPLEEKRCPKSLFCFCK
uniref:Disease resistance protein RPP13 n=1 Tax=Aegilops tauschii TaxID=37682 RepID=M8C3H2_AEGTA